MRLTLDDEALASRVEEEWLATALSAAPTDRAAAEHAVVEAYVSAGLAPPARVLWLGSPCSGALAAAIVTDPALTAASGLPRGPGGGGRVSAR